MGKSHHFITIATVVIFGLFILTAGIKKEYGSRDLVYDLYSQALKQNRELKDIEDGIESFYKRKIEALEKYNAFTAYNNRYYSDAIQYPSRMTDSITKQKTTSLIHNSEARYKAQMADWEKRIAGLNASENELMDLHRMLMIVVTEPMIRKYQASELPDNNKVKEVNNELQTILERIKAITK